MRQIEFKSTYLEENLESNNNMLEENKTEMEKVFKDKMALQWKLEEISATYPDPLTITKNKEALQQFDVCLSKSLNVIQSMKLMVEDTFSC